MSLYRPVAIAARKPPPAQSVPEFLENSKKGCAIAAVIGILLAVFLGALWWKYTHPFPQAIIDGYAHRLLDPHVKQVENSWAFVPPEGKPAVRHGSVLPILPSQFSYVGGPVVQAAWWELPLALRAMPQDVGTVAVCWPSHRLQAPSAPEQAQVFCFDASTGEYLGQADVGPPREDHRTTYPSIAAAILAMPQQ